MGRVKWMFNNLVLFFLLFSKFWDIKIITINWFIFRSLQYDIKSNQYIFLADYNFFFFLTIFPVAGILAFWFFGLESYLMMVTASYLYEGLVAAALVSSLGYLSRSSNSCCLNNKKLFLILNNQYPNHEWGFKFMT